MSAVVSLYLLKALKLRPVPIAQRYAYTARPLICALECVTIIVNGLERSLDASNELADCCFCRPYRCRQIFEFRAYQYVAFFMSTSGIFVALIYAKHCESVPPSACLT